jgi:hypothetical protein
MELSNFKLAAILVSIGLLPACGSVGVPVPPSLEVARPVNDLKATRKGDRVFLTWTAPARTTDGHSITHPGETQICGNPASAMAQCGTPVAKIKPGGNQRTSQPVVMSYTDRLPESIQAMYADDDLFYAVKVMNSYGRSGGLSNQVSVPAAPTLPAPLGFRAQLVPEGVQLTWLAETSPAPASGLHFAVRVYRREQGQKTDVLAGESELAPGSTQSLTDRSLEWEKTYSYRATTVTYIEHPAGKKEQVEGEDTPALSVFAHDVFPPAAPTELQAVFSGPGQKTFIDLIWSPSTETDLAGYNVYRREGEARATKLNSELVKSPAWRDSTVETGHDYSYSVTAVDARGNESAHSAEAAESVPAQ